MSKPSSEPAPLPPAPPTPGPEAAPSTLDPRPSTLDRAIRFCLENKLVVMLILLATVVWGVAVAPFDWETGRLPRSPVPTDAIPDIGENQQIVFTRWPGRSPQDVEDQITYPLTVSLLGIPGVKTIRSISMFGFSSIYVIFGERAEFYWSRSRVLEKLNSLPAGTLPDGVQPALGPDATALGQVFWYTLEGRGPEGEPAGGWGLHELRTVQDWTVRYALMSAAGVSEVASVGGFVQEYQIDVDPDAMRAYGVTLDQVFAAVKMSNADVGARTIEVNKVEYVIRGLGFIKSLADLESTVIVARENVPVTIKDVAHVALGPALRRGALDKEGAEAVGGVVVVRYGFNPLAAIKNVKAKIAEIAPGLPTKAVVDYARATRGEVERFAARHGFEPYAGAGLNQAAWLAWLRANPRGEWPGWLTTSQVTVVPFYDRTGLIYETLGTLSAALSEEILVTIIVVLISVMHLRSSALISTSLPLAVLMCFILMRLFGVDANIVALSGIAIAIGTIVDMSIVVCENILRHLEDAGPGERGLEVVYRGASEVGGAVLTAVATTVVSFLPVFVMTGAEGRLFRPLAFTKTFALVASIVVALTVVPPGALMLFTWRIRRRLLRIVAWAGLAAAGLAVWLWQGWWVAGVVMILAGAWHIGASFIPERVRWLRRVGPVVASLVAVAVVGVILTRHWEPLGPERGLGRNLVFVGALLGGLLLLFYLVRLAYAPLLRLFLAVKPLFLCVPLAIVLLGLFAWRGPSVLYGPMESAERADFGGREQIDGLVEAGLLEPRGERLLWTAAALGASREGVESMLEGAGVAERGPALEGWARAKRLTELKGKSWGAPHHISRAGLRAKIDWHLARHWDGLGKEFMPPLDEGSFLLMPATMPHASIGEALDVLAKQDMAIRAIPEVELVVGKIGRVESALDPAPVSMVETVISYKPEYVTDKDGRRIHFRYGEEAGQFVRDERGELIPDPDGRPYRQWRDEIGGPDDIWNAILEAAEIPGTTSAPKLQPIAARLVMLQSGMRAPMGVKVRGPDLESIETVALDVERLLKEVDGVEPATVAADRIVGKPYLEIDIDREAIARYGLHIRAVQDVIEVAIGGRTITTTVEGRERYPVRVRYQRELRDQIETLGRILVPAPDGTQIPLEQVADIRYVRGPQAIKSEDTFLVGYVVFDKKPGYAEVDVVEACQRYLETKRKAGDLVLPAGVSYTFAGNYENQVRARRTLSVVLPLALFIIFIILYFQFRSVPTTLLVFSGIAVAWAGGFILIWCYGQPWFLDFSIYDVNMRDLFQIHPVNLSVAVWVGFLALFGIATDDGVVMATYLDQQFAARRPATIREVRQAVVEGGRRRVRPCLMTTATTILALLPVLASTGRGSDVMVPMAIPSFGGMLIEAMTMFVVPVLYALIKETKIRLHIGSPQPTEGDSAEGQPADGVVDRLHEPQSPSDGGDDAAEGNDVTAT